jgi:hypothetical protein
MSCTRARGYAAAVIIALGLGCARAEHEVPQESTAPGAETSPGSGGADGLIQGTPAGGLGNWIEEIRTGLDTLPELASRDPAAAKNQALLLYVGRQEYIEIYYGTTGRAVKDAELAESVMTAEARFHELLQVVNQPDGSIDGGALGKAAQALDRQYDRVLGRARELELDTNRLELAGAKP